MNKLKNILVGVDFFPGTQSALRQAVRGARWNGARLPVLHGIECLVLKDEAKAVQRLYEIKDFVGPVGMGPSRALSHEWHTSWRS